MSDQSKDEGAPGRAPQALSPTRAREANLSKLADVIRACAWSAGDTPGWARSIAVPATLLLSEVVEPVKVGAGPCRANKPDELVWVNIYGLADVPFADVIKRTLIREIEPFVIGVGEVAVDQTPEGLVVRRRDRGDEHRGHEVAPTPKRAQ